MPKTFFNSNDDYEDRFLKIATVCGAVALPLLIFGALGCAVYELAVIWFVPFLVMLAITCLLASTAAICGTFSDEG